MEQATTGVRRKGYYECKQFAIKQDTRGVQKVGTDAMVFGGWVSSMLRNGELKPPRKLIEIGTGTGIIALMLWQTLHERSSKAVSEENFGGDLTALDINESAIVLAQENFASSSSRHSDWRRWTLNAVHCPVQQYSVRATAATHGEGVAAAADVIVSAPPYFDANSKIENDMPVARHQARFLDTLSLEDIFFHSHRLLNPGGHFLMVQDAKLHDRILACASHQKFLVPKCVTVRDNPQASVSRYLYMFQKRPTDTSRSLHSATEKDDITLRTRPSTPECPRRPYTDQYKLLTQDFHLYFPETG